MRGDVCKPYNREGSGGRRNHPVLRTPPNVRRGSAEPPYIGRFSTKCKGQALNIIKI